MAVVYRLVMAAALLLLGTHSAISFAAEEVIFSLRVNGLGRGESVVELVGNDEVRFAEEEVKRLGFSKAALARLRGSDGKYSLAPTAEVKLRVDLDTLTLHVDVPATWFETINFSLGTRSTVKVAQLDELHGWLNYAVDVQAGSGADPDARLDTRLVLTRGRWTLVSEQGVERLASNPTWTRKFTTLQFDDAVRLAQFSLGDVGNDPGLGSSTTNIRGVRWSRRYDFDPAVVSAPTFSWQYDLTSPSTIDVFVDQMRVRSFSAGPGPLNLSELSYFAGLRNVEVNVTQRGGAQTRIAIPYYFSNDLLAAGKTSFDAVLGVRPNEHGQSDWIATGSFRHGLTDAFTWGFGGEARKIYQSARTELAVRDERFGQLSLLAALSRRAGDDSIRRSAVLTHSLSRNTISWQGYLLAQDAGFGLDRMPVPTQALLVRQAAASLNVAISNRHSFAVNAGVSHFENAPRKLSYGARLSQNWGKGMSSWIAIARAEARNQRSNTISAGFSMSLGPRWSISATGEARSDGTHQASIRGARSGSDDGWNNLRIAALNRESRVALESYVERPMGIAELALSARAEQIGSKTEYAANARLSGATVFAKGSVWFSPSISQSFALIDIPGTQNVRVYHNSQLVGRTASDGTLILPNLAGYASNQVRIDDRDIPIEIELDKVQKEVAPRSNAGVHVQFVSRTVSAVGGTLVTSRDGKQHAVASAQLTITPIDASADPLQSSTDGQGGFYLDGLAPGRWRIAAINRTTRCAIELTVNKTNAAFTDVGELLCVATQ